jgi:peptidoglycan/xylan/chitin deacetylase (PgdA/CDA1 family)
MYHYVRDLAKSVYPRLKALELSAFEGQLDFLSRHYQPVTVDTVAAAIVAGETLPDNALLLTFDDGYREHYDMVMPRLIDRGMHGAFYPVASAVAEGRLLDINKLHFILAAAQSADAVVAALHGELDRHRLQWSLPPNESFVSRLATPSRLDPASVAYVKRMLQYELPASLRDTIVTSLLRRFVSEDERGFCEELYMDRRQLRAMADAGMHIGSHGYSHLWLNRVDQATQEDDIDRSLAFLESILGQRDGWTFCYPFGGWSPDVQKVLTARGCTLAFTTEMRVAAPEHDVPLRLPRVDTVYLPTSAADPGNEWTVAGAAMPRPATH